MGKRGVLSNSYIPHPTPQVTAKLLSKLNTSSLYDLCLFWCKWSPMTRPKNADRVFEEISQMKADKRPKRRLIDKILSEYWLKGLNLLQMSQIDVQNIIDKPTNFSWISSTARTSNDKKFIINLNSQVFLETLISNLSNLYLSHIYISKHPHYPLILIRIQVFDYSIVPLMKSNKRQFIISRKPFFVAIPINSPHIIYSELEEHDLVARIVMQSIEVCLSTTLQQVRLFKDEGENGVRTLETMHIFKGVSRFGGSLGSWAPYADGVVDISPLGDPNEHIELNPDKIYDNESKEYDDDNAKARGIREKIANLRFKGTELPLQSERLYEDDRPIKRRKKENQGDGGNNDDGESSEQPNPYKSIAPIQKLQSQVTSSIRNSNRETTIKIRFEGNDVFAGLHELCVEGIADPAKIPGWLTGEEGNKNIEVKQDDTDLI